MLYSINVFVHVLAAFLWLGGMFFLAAVGAPVLRKVEDPDLRSELFQTLGTRFRWLGWICIAILLATGVGNLHFSGLLTREVWIEGALWGTPLGKALAAKVLLVTLMVSLAAVHDFVVGPGAAEAIPGSARALRLRRRAAWLGRANTLFGILLLYAAVRLARGG